MTVKELVDLIGATAAAKLMNHCGGKPLYIPSHRIVSLPRRNREIYDKYMNHKIPVKELVIIYGLTQVSINRIIHEQREKSK